MQVRNTSARWGSVAQFLHWLIVSLIITQVILALTAEELHGMAKLAMLARHKSVGITILMLAVVRFGWRLVNPTPPLPLTLKPYERFLANFTHAALYVLIFALPITGWIMSSARGFPVSWFNQFQLSGSGDEEPPAVRGDAGNARSFWRGCWAQSRCCTCSARSSTILC